LINQPFALETVNSLVRDNTQESWLALIRDA